MTEPRIGMDGDAPPKVLYDIGIDSLYDDLDDRAHDEKVQLACAKLEFPIDGIFPPNLAAYVKSLAASMGTPVDYHVQPMVGITALLMNGSVVEVLEPTETKKGHLEPVVVNCMALGSKSTNKTGAFKYHENQLLDIERMHIKKRKREFQDAQEESKEVDEPRAKWPKKDEKLGKGGFSSSLHQLIIKKCTESGLASVVFNEKSEKNVMLLYEEFYQFQNLLDFSNTRSSFLPMFLESYGASNMRGNTQTRGLQSADAPFIQVLVYGQPMVFVSEVAKNPTDPSATWDRFFIVNPERIICNLEDCHRVELPTDLDLSVIYRRIYDTHFKKGNRYVMANDAMEFLYEVDKAIKALMRMYVHDEDLCGMLGKDIQKIQRVSAVMYNLRVGAQSKAFNMVYSLMMDMVHKVTGDGDHREVVEILPTQQLTDLINEAVDSEDFVLAQSLKMKRDKLESDGGGDTELERPTFVIKKEDVQAAVHYVQHCSKITRIVKRAAMDVHAACPSPQRVKCPPPKKRATNYWADDITNLKHPFEFLMKHSDKIIQLWENATDGEVPMADVTSKKLHPAASSARPRGAHVNRELSLYFMKILEYHGLVSVSEDLKVVSLQTVENTLDTPTKLRFRNIMKKHPDFNPFIEVQP